MNEHIDDFKIVKSEFITSAVSFNQYPEVKRDELAFIGRSNVGKSSLINSLCGRRNLAKTSSTPGKTRTVNYYLINDLFYFVDLPGYGYAKLSKSERENLGKVIDAYFKNTKNLKMIFLLVDIRHNPTSDDKLMIDWIKFYNLPYKIIATKADKINKTEIIKNKKNILTDLNINESSVIVYSSHSKLNYQVLLNEIYNILKVF
ncbi:MAG: ribosome biogenesis GTP-binding protein YihA/YsxC [Oscillospiraceae bacterium]|nr:ribosome biogenesis GTP-binding protein YihA/YsxC [Oscillospiraceae bacterium]